MDAFAWGVLGAVATVAAAVATIVFGLIPLLQRHKEVQPPSGEAGGEALPAGGEVAPVVVGEIPQEPLGFQPRADLLAALDASGSGSRVMVAHAVTGMRGVGKTHLAAAYARARLAEQWRLVAWVNVEEETGLLAGLAEVAAALGLAAGVPDERAAGRAVRHRLEADGDRCLLVFDNATDPGLLRPFIPAAGGARVIITSNERSMAALGTGVPVDVFSEQEALTFLAASTGQADADGARALAEELGWLPLALAQAAAVIASQCLPYATYLDRLHHLPAEQMLTAEEAGQYPLGAAAAILLSLQYVSAGEDGCSCEAVMDLLAVLSAAGVRRSLIHAVAHNGLPGTDGALVGLPPEAADRVLGQLAGTSLLTFSVDGASVTVHRLVMRVIRESLAARGALATICSAAADLLDGLAGSLHKNWHQDRLLARDLVEQILALSESFTQCPASDDLTRQMLDLRFWALYFLNELADSAAQAIMLGEQLTIEQDQALGPGHPDTLASRNNLASAYRAAGRIDEAITLGEQILATRERVLGPDHPDTLASRNNLASAYRAAGRTDEAITLGEQTLVACERVLGPDHLNTLTTRYNLARAYRTRGRIDKAITLHEQTLAACERVLGSDHPNTLTSRHNLARAYQAAGRTDEAITLGEQTLAACERILGPDHPDTLASRHNLARAYQAAGRTDEAITLDEQTLAARERVLGPDHRDTLVSRQNLANAYLDVGGASETGSNKASAEDP